MNTETKKYVDGTVATGDAPLPKLSPQQQDLFEQFQAHVFGMRKAAYEFGQSDLVEDHQLMLDEQHSIFTMFETLLQKEKP